MDEPALFEVDRPPPAEPAPRPSPDVRRRERQAEAMAAGQHPLSVALAVSIPLHEQAAPADDRTAPGRRCGTCWYRERLRYHNRSYAKCMVDDGRPSRPGHPGWPPRFTHGPGTDVRAWWPACRDHTYGDPALSPDAARCVPEVAR